MANLITVDYFVNEINLPVPTTDDRIDFITRYEPEFLKRIFGYTLYKLLSTYVASGETASEQRIKDIVEGKEFTEVSGETTFYYKWNGLKNAEFISPIANYVYFKYVKLHETETTNQGERRNKSENADNVSNEQKLINAWNTMVDLIGDESDHNSLYYFMNENIEDYPEWEFNGFERINSFGI